MSDEQNKAAPLGIRADGRLRIYRGESRIVGFIRAPTEEAARIVFGRWKVVDSEGVERPLLWAVIDVESTPTRQYPIETSGVALADIAYEAVALDNGLTVFHPTRASLCRFIAATTPAGESPKWKGRIIECVAISVATKVATWRVVGDVSLAACNVAEGVKP